MAGADLVIEIPKYTINYEREGGGRSKEPGHEMDRLARNRHRAGWRNFPDQDPKAVNFVDLRNWVLALPGFDDDPKRSGEKILEAIQMAWIDEAD